MFYEKYKEKTEIKDSKAFPRREDHLKCFTHYFFCTCRFPISLFSLLSLVSILFKQNLFCLLSCLSSYLLDWTKFLSISEKKSVIATDWLPYISSRKKLILCNKYYWCCTSEVAMSKKWDRVSSSSMSSSSLFTFTEIVMGGSLRTT